MNDMNTSMESLCPTGNMQSESVPTRQNGQHTRGQPPPSGTKPPEPKASSQQKVQRSQPMHITAVRWDPEPPGELVGCRDAALCKLRGDGGDGCWPPDGLVKSTGRLHTSSLRGLAVPGWAWSLVQDR